MNRLFLITILIFTFSYFAFAQVAVSPNNLTAYSQGATSAYLTFTNVANLSPAEAVWCGEIIPAAPDIGFKCDPATVFGTLPARYDQSRLNGNRYTGTGRLKGRWELVRPGEELPNNRDLLSEAALPPEERGTQRRYALLSRFSVNLPPGGKYVLPGPENWQIDKSVEGLYVLLFRVEASDAPNSLSNTGANVTPTGAVAGFAMPTLRYYVGNSNNTDILPITKTEFNDDFDNQLLPVTLRWKEIPNAKIYRLEIEDAEQKNVFSAILLPPDRQYQLPSFIRQLLTSKVLKWKIAAIDESGKVIEETKFSDVK